MNPAPSDDLVSIDELWSQARAKISTDRAAIKARIIRRTADPAPQGTLALFADPKNWTRSKGVALVHADSETLLGNFSEYLHNSVPGCSKLIREEGPISVSEVRRVEGSWWLEEKQRPEERKEWHTKRPAIIHLHLSKLGVYSPATEVIVHESYGAIARVELAVETIFAAESRDGAAMLTLAAGTNVLEVMSQDSKMALRMEMGKGAL